MGRILFFVLLFAAMFIAWNVSRRRVRRAGSRARQELKKVKEESKSDLNTRVRKLEIQSGAATQQCEVCGSFYPEEDGIEVAGHHYCSVECAKKA